MDVKDYDLVFKELSERAKTDLIVVHHTGNPTDDDLSAEQIHRAHVNMGWAGIGYHYVIRKDGTVEAGRPVDKVGAHAYGFNSRSVGIMVCGNFDIGVPTKAQLNTLPMLIAELCKKYNLIASKDVVVGHRDLMATQCPGDNLYAEMDTIRGNAEWYRNN